MRSNTSPNPVTGTVYPVFGIVYGLSTPKSIYTWAYKSVLATGVAIQTFQVQDRHQLRKESDRNALYFFIIAIVTTIAIGLQMFLFAAGAASLTNKLRKLSFKAILRQDSKWYSP
jgi:ATP-binding cassette subfamily B (MDR/TAP) protein 1